MREAEERQYKRQNEYNAANYDRIQLMLPKGSKEKLKEIAAKRGQSLNAFLREIIEREI